MSLKSWLGSFSTLTSTCTGLRGGSGIIEYAYVEFDMSILWKHQESDGLRKGGDRLLRFLHSADLRYATLSIPITFFDKTRRVRGPGKIRVMKHDHHTVSRHMNV